MDSLFPFLQGLAPLQHVGLSRRTAVDRVTGMYGPPPFCKRRMRMQNMVCANVFGLCWSSDLLASMECAAPSSYLVSRP